MAREVPAEIAPEKIDDFDEGILPQAGKEDEPTRPAWEIELDVYKSI